MRHRPFLFLTQRATKSSEIVLTEDPSSSSLSNRTSRRGSPSSPATEAERKRVGEVRAPPLESVFRPARMEQTYFDSGVGCSAPENLFLVLVFAFGSFLARLLLDRVVYKPCSMKLLRYKAVPMANDEAKWTKIIKSCESMWKLTYYTSVQIWVISIIKQEPWSLNTKEYFKGWPNQELKSSLLLFYMCECGFYIYSIVALIAWETRRKDFSIMMSHHIITSILIGFSYITSFFRIGTIILALHDTSDVFMESAKLFKYSGMEMAASFFFGLFAISWFLLRLIYFPFWIIKSSSYESFEFLSWMNQFPTALYYTFNTMLITLLIFHAYWWKLIFAMIMKQMSNKGQVGEDIRSDSEDEG